MDGSWDICLAAKAALLEGMLLLGMVGSTWF